MILKKHISKGILGGKDDGEKINFVINNIISTTYWF